jgi:hypothetical protein
MNFPLLADRINWHTAVNSFDLQQQTYYGYLIVESLIPQSAVWLSLSVFSAAAPLIEHKLHMCFGLSPLKLVFCH